VVRISRHRHLLPGAGGGLEESYQMQSLVFLMLLGLLGGIAVGVQSPLASLISQRIGVLESIFILHLGGMLGAGIPLLLLGGGRMAAWRHAPWYALGAGFLGLVIVGAVSATIPRLGATATIILVVTGQLLVGVLIDHFGVFETLVRPLDLLRVGGLVLVMVGAWLVVR
jgi:transporter family-2 protein